MWVGDDKRYVWRIISPLIVGRGGFRKWVRVASGCAARRDHVADADTLDLRCGLVMSALMNDIH